MSDVAQPATSTRPGARAAGAACAEFIFVDRTQLGGEGPRVGIKDSIDVAGVPTRLGSACRAQAPPAPLHAAVVRDLLAAGCRIVGKTNLHELAFGVTGINGWTGTPVNPRAPQRVPGGSSSGSAVAVAAGLVEFALGTDTGGSIRIPAACCAVFGLKPTFGRVSRAGVHPAHSTLDCVGPLAGDVPMLEHAMTLIDPSFRRQAAPAAATIGWLEAVPCGRVMAAATRAAVDATELTVRSASLPSFGAAFAAGLAIIGVEIWAAFGHLAGSAGLGSDVRTRLLASGRISPEEVAAAERVRAAFTAQVDAALSQVDALALPTLADPPLTLAAAADARAALQMSSLVRPFNLSGHPAVTIPIGVEGLPAGLQLVGRKGEDEVLCALARLVAARLHPPGSGGLG
jgi:amidase